MSAMMIRSTPEQIEAERTMERAARRLADYIRNHPGPARHLGERRYGEDSHTCSNPDECPIVRQELSADLIAAADAYERLAR
jgi:hypothetical protein